MKIILALLICISTSVIGSIAFADGADTPQKIEVKENYFFCRAPHLHVHHNRPSPGHFARHNCSDRTRVIQVIDIPVPNPDPESYKDDDPSHAPDPNSKEEKDSKDR